MVGTPRPSVSQSSRLSGTPSRPAMARRWTTALVEPPMAPFTRIAFSNAWRVRICEMRMSSCTSATARRPASCASALRRESTAGIAALPAIAMPSASAMLAMVDAVPMVMQWPGLRDMPDSASAKSAGDMLPARSSSENLNTSVPEPSARPRKRPVSIGPPESTIVGRSQLAAPMRSAGVVLSQPVSSTTPSIGLARIDSSTSMLTRLRKSIAVGLRLLSPSDMTGNSTGIPPAS